MTMISSLSSVDIVKELNGLRNDRTYFHDIKKDDVDGVPSILCKVKRIESILILKSRYGTNRTEDFTIMKNINLLERVYEVLQVGKVGMRFNRDELFRFMNMIKEEPELEQVDKLVVHLRGIKLMPQEELNEWIMTVGNVLDRLKSLDDMTNTVKKMVVDDGLTEKSLIVNTEEVDIKDIMEGDVVDVIIKPSRYTQDKGYIIATYDEDVSSELEQLNTVN